MPIDAKLREMLVCPNELDGGKRCLQPLTEAKTGEGEGLRCDRCKLVYAIKDEIPIMLPDQATKL